MLKYWIVFISLCFSLTSLAQSSQEWKADSLSELELFDEALTIYQKELEYLSKTEDPTSFLRLSIKKAIIHQTIKEYTVSKTILQDAINNLVEPVQKDSLLALAYHKLGVAVYLGDYDDEKAIDFWTKALVIRRTIFPNNHIDIVKGLKNIGNSYINLDNLELAKESLEKSLQLQLSRSNTDSIALAETYSELGYIFTSTEDLNKAEIYLNSAKIIYEKLFSDEPWELFYIYQNLYEFYAKRKDFQQMAYYPKQLIHLYENITDKYDEDYWNIADSYFKLGKTYELKDSLGLAIDYYSQALTLNLKFVNDRKKNIEDNYTNLSFIYRKQGDFQKALESIDLANQLVEEQNDPIGKAEILNSKGVILMGLNREPESLETLNQALSYLKKNNKIIDKPLYLIILSDKLSLLNQIQKKDAKASSVKQIDHLSEEILALVQSIRHEYQSDESKQLLSSNTRSIFEKMLQANLLAFQQKKDNSYKEKAFSIAEQAKAMVLLEAVNETEATQFINAPQKLLSQINQCKKSIGLLEKKAFQGEVANVEGDLIVLYNRLESLNDSLKIISPNYYRLKYSTSEIDLKTTRKNLDGYLIEYFVGDSTIYTFVIDNESTDIQILQTPLNFPLKTWVTNLRKGIYSTFTENERDDIKQKTSADTLAYAAYNLHEKLIKPITDKIKLSEKITIIPDGILGYIPFEILLKTKPTNNQYFGSMDYLVKDHQISYSYSTALLLEMQQKKLGKESKGFLGIAPSFENSQDVPQFGNQNTRAGLVPLDFNIPEVETIQDLVGGVIQSGNSATKLAFLAEVSNKKFLHLATHGKANDQKGDYAYLAFAKTAHQEDQFLYNRDLYTIPLNTEMVVLSACETGIGELQKGEGIISLARGFSYAGAKSIITTLWSINDEKSMELMLNFYSKLKEGQSKDAALRQAKLDFIDKYSHRAHPFYWAAFIPIGDMAAVHFSQDYTWAYAGGLMLLIALIFWFWRKKR